MFRRLQCIRQLTAFVEVIFFVEVYNERIMPDSHSNSSKIRNSLLHSDTLSRVLGEDAMQFLRCGICMNFFEVPIVLPCGHTFCLQCLTQMCTHASLNHAPNASQDVRIGCPNCHVLIYATPILRRNVTCNFIIQSLIECLRMREDRGTHAHSQTVNTEGAGDSKNSSSSTLSPLTPSLSSLSSTATFNDNDHRVDVMRMLNDLDRVTMTLARSNVVDRAFMEIEDIRKDHLARERQRQAERDAKTRDQVRAVQSIMRQSREEEQQQQQQQQQRKHQNQHHHFQQQQQQRQLQQRQILPRPQLMDTKSQQQQQQQQQRPQQQQPQQQQLQQQPVSVNNNTPQQLNLFLWKCPLLANVNSDKCPLQSTKPQPLSNTPQTSLKQQQQKHQHPQQQLQQQLQQQQSQPPPPQPHQLQAQNQQQQRFSPYLFQLPNRDEHLSSPQQTQKDASQPQLQPPLPPQLHHHHHQHLQQHQRQGINSIPLLKQPTAAVSASHTHPGTASPLREATQDKPPVNNNNMAAMHLPPENDPTKSPQVPANEELQGVGVTVQQRRAPDINSGTSGLQCAQLNNDPAVMSFSLVTGMAPTSK